MTQSLTTAEIAAAAKNKNARRIAALARIQQGSRGAGGSFRSARA
jgi:hypothetical protein